MEGLEIFHKLRTGSYRLERPENCPEDAVSRIIIELIQTLHSVSLKRDIAQNEKTGLKFRHCAKKTYFYTDLSEDAGVLVARTLQASNFRQASDVSTRMWSK